MPEVEIQQALSTGQAAVCQGGAQDVERRAVFDRAAGVEPLCFGQHLHAWRKAGSHPPQRQQRRIAHRGFKPLQRRNGLHREAVQFNCILYYLTAHSSLPLSKTLNTQG